MTVIDHPLRQTAELNSRIQAEFGELACWRATLDMGIIVFLDFGQRQNLLGRKGPVAIGALRVLIHGEEWVLERGGEEILLSDVVLDKEDEVALDRVFVGLSLLRVGWSADYCELTFSDDVVLKVDRASEAPDCDNIVEIRFSNGDCVDCMANGVIETEGSDG